MRLYLFALSRARTGLRQQQGDGAGARWSVTGRRNVPGDAGPVEARDSQAAEPPEMKRREAPFRGAGADQRGCMRLNAGGGLAARDTGNAETASNGAGGGLQQ